MFFHWKLLFWTQNKTKETVTSKCKWQTYKFLCGRSNLTLNYATVLVNTSFWRYLCCICVMERRMEQVFSLMGAFQYVANPLISEEFSHLRCKMLTRSRCFWGSWMRQWRISRCLEQNLWLALSWFLWPVLFSQLPCASCCLAGFSTSVFSASWPDIQPLGGCAACSQRNVSSVSWQARTNFLCLVPMCTSSPRWWC